VKLDGALRGRGFEVGCDIAKTDGHVRNLLKTNCLYY
jgi:hypothetical protein